MHCPSGAPAGAGEAAKDDQQSGPENRADRQPGPPGITLTRPVRGRPAARAGREPAHVSHSVWVILAVGAQEKKKDVNVKS